MGNVVPPPLVPPEIMQDVDNIEFNVVLSNNSLPPFNKNLTIFSNTILSNYGIADLDTWRIKMDLRKILAQQEIEYQLTVARAVVNFWRADIDTREKLLDSYRALIQEYDDEELYNQEQEIKNQGLDIDQYLDDPRHGQSSKGEH